MPNCRPILFSLGLAALLGACATNHGPESPDYAYPSGLSLSLARPLTIPPGEATVRLQYGRAVARNGVQETDPWCIFEQDAVAETAQTVQPETFRVIGIQRRVETFSGMPVMSRHFMGTGLGRNDGPSQIYYITEFRLHSDARPGVRSLTCQHDQGAAGVGIPRHLTVAEIRQALGDHFVLGLPR